MNNSMVTTALTLPGYEVVRSLGIVRGITVRSRSIVGMHIPRDRGHDSTLMAGSIPLR